MSKLIIFLLVIAAIVVALFAISSPETPKITEIPRSSKVQETPDEKQDDDLRYGSIDAPVQIIEFMDYKCPNCGVFHDQTVPELKKSFIDNEKASIIVKPIDVIGPDSRRTALGAYCAHDQGQFISYHDAVMSYLWDTYYEKRNYKAEFEDVVTEKVLRQILDDSIIDIAELVLCINDERHAGNLESNKSLAAANKLYGTPGFILGDQSFTGGQPFKVFETLINLQLEDQRT